MISCILLIWVGVALDMPSGYFVLLGIMALIKTFSFGFDIAKTALEKK